MYIKFLRTNFRETTGEAFKNHTEMLSLSSLIKGKTFLSGILQIASCIILIFT